MRLRDLQAFKDIQECEEAFQKHVEPAERQSTRIPGPVKRLKCLQKPGSLQRRGNL